MMVEGRKLIAILVILPAALAGWYLMARGDRSNPNAAPVSQAITTEPASEPAGAQALPSFDIARVDAAGRAVISGHAAPGATVTLFTGGAESGSGTANERGEWVILLSRDLSGATDEISARSQGPGGAERRSAERLIALRRGDGEPLLVLERPGRPSRILQWPGEVAPVLRIDVIDYGPDGKVAVSGHATPGRIVRFYLDNEPAGIARASEQGAWSLAAPDAAAGTYMLRVDELDPKGGVAERIEAPFARLDGQAAAKTLLGKANLAARAADSQWSIARRLAGTGYHYTVIYGVNQARPRNPSLVYPGQIFEQGEAVAE